MSNALSRWLRPRAVFPAMLAGVLGAASAQAQDDKEDYNLFEITPFAGYTLGGEFENPFDDTERDVEEDASFGIIVNIAADGPDRHYEFLYSNISTEVEGNTPLDLDIQYVQVGGTVSYTDSERVIPYFAGSVGATFFSPDTRGFDDETEFSFSLGGGLKFPINDNIGIRFDARAFVTLLDGNSDIFCVSSPPVGSCDIRTKSDTFVQFSAGLGITVGF